MVWVQAYSSISVPQRVLSTGIENGSTGGGIVTITYTLNIPEDGILQSFLASVDCLGFPGTGAVGEVTFKIKRNGALLSASTVDFATFSTSSGDRGLMYVESLNFLAGAYVQAGEQFQLVIEKESAGGVGLNYNANLNMTIGCQAKAFVI